MPAFELSERRDRTVCFGIEEQLMKNGNARFRGLGFSSTVLILICGLLMTAGSPAVAQQQGFPGEIVGVGEMPQVRNGP